ncbi:hypothetical protein D0863_01551 [Hortaea werneckii]|uniref:Uncharacterized protein n=1 Tax=Hortaea werneckii TaxID=91943 RepID=A0A3M7ELZ2_HORWE|nr:hypothetical protein D0863_01551 [Hortaea werneckii]
MSSFLLPNVALALLLPYVSNAQQCNSYGIDFTNGGSYFQNSNSSELFTASQEFDGCQDDTSNNIFVDPNGDQTQCSDTPLLPDNTPQLVNCTQWPKSKLYTGDWSLIVISNNGDGDPIAKERDFHLSVGPQQTVTVSDAVKITNTFTPVVNQTVTSTEIESTTVPSSTRTANVAPGTTITPKASTITSTRGLITLTQRVQTVQVSTVSTTVEASCSLQGGPTRVQDNVASILPTILGELDDVARDIIQDVGSVSDYITQGLIGLFSLSKRDEVGPASLQFKRAILEGLSPDEELKRAFVRERHERLARGLRKRAPDQATTTVTASDVATSTVEKTGSTQTQTITETVSSTSTITSGIALVDGQGSGGRTATASASTRTVTIQRVFATTTVTRTKSSTVTNTMTQTPAGASESCASRGGNLA